MIPVLLTEKTAGGKISRETWKVNPLAPDARPGRKGAAAIPAFVGATSLMRWHGPGNIYP